MLRIRKNDTVIIRAGKDKGKTGKVIRVFADKNLVIVEQANMVKKHQRPTQTNQMGGIVDIESPINASNVMLLDGKTGKGTRFNVTGEKKEKARVAAGSGTVFD
jgi:large subunit ribosomal protein L24